MASGHGKVNWRAVGWTRQRGRTERASTSPSGKQYGLLMKERAVLRGIRLGRFSEQHLLPPPPQPVSVKGVDNVVEICYHKTSKKHRRCDCLHCYEIVRGRL